MDIGIEYHYNKEDERKSANVDIEKRKTFINLSTQTSAKSVNNKMHGIVRCPAHEFQSLGTEQHRSSASTASQVCFFPPFVCLFVCLCVGITSSIYELESDTSAHIPLPLEVLPWQKIHGKNNTSCLYFLVEVFIKIMKVSVASLEESSVRSCVYQHC